MSGPSTSTTNSNQMQETSTRFAPWVTNAGQNLYQGLASQYPHWDPYTGPLSASFGPGTGTATAFATNALGGGNPQLSGATGAFQSVINSVNPAGGPGQYMNPYVQATLQPTLQNIQDVTARQHQQNGAAATLAGAYGGTGQGVMDALANKYEGQNVANASGQAYSNAYNAAIQQQQQSLQSLLGAGSGLNQTAGANMSLAALLAGIGQQQQSAGQQGILNAINLNQQNQTMPLSQGAMLASILQGLPKDTSGTSYGNSTSTQTTPNNTLSSLLGAALGAGLAGVAGPAGAALGGTSGILGSLFSGGK